MLFNAFSNSNLGKWIIPGAGLVWFLGCFLLQIQYGLSVEIATVDSLVFGLMLIAGLSVIQSMFRYFLPKKENLGQILGVPLMLSILGAVGHQFLMIWWFSEEVQYLEFLRKTLYLRLAVLAGAEILGAMMALLASKLEDQEQLNRRESQMLQLSKDAELAQLRQQLQPHFLFNSLNSINALVVSQPQKAREMVLQLSEFLRGTIRKDSQSWISLEEELNYLKMYLDIERVRFGHRLEVEFLVEKESNAIKLPQLLIQPLVENAIKHGLYGVTGEVKIEISGKKDGNYFILEVKNPFDPESTAPEGTGFGLSSVERRLFLLFGRTDLLESGPQGEYFKVRLKIPQFQ
ncbi:MAG TPA: histidine kinase [Algoriphagus sp.]|nr:histidine kinase [Algoriphagus sp.]